MHLKSWAKLNNIQLRRLHLQRVQIVNDMKKDDLKIFVDSKNDEKTEDKTVEKSVFKFFGSKAIIYIIAIPVCLVFAFIQEFVGNDDPRMTITLIWGTFVCILLINAFIYSFYWKKEFGEDILQEKLNFACFILIVAGILIQIFLP